MINYQYFQVLFLMKNALEQFKRNLTQGVFFYDLEQSFDLT